MKSTIQNIAKSILLVTLYFSLNTAFGQAPQKFSYQTVVRNTSNALVANANVGIKISILQGSATGTSVYSESHTAATNANGLASIQIGGGSVLSGNLTTINWSTATYFIKTEVDPAGGTAYSISGTSQLLSVPYALSAANGGKVELTNTGFGINTLSTNTGINNTAYGANALRYNIAGANNSAFGINSMLNNNGSFNTAMGTNSLRTNTAGVWNTAIGEGALYNSTADSNIAIGGLALSDLTTGTNNIGIGNNSQVPSLTGSYQMSIQNVIYGTDLSSTASGKIGIGTSAPSTKLDVIGDTYTSGTRYIFTSGTSNPDKMLFSHSPDYSNWGIQYQDVSDKLNFVSNGSTVLGVDLGTHNVGIGTSAPTTKLDVAGTTKTTDLQVTNGAGAGKVLTSDATGNATWQTSTSSAPQVYGFSGSMANLITSTTYAFAGPTATVTITSSSQKITAVASNSMSLQTAGSQSANIGMCYKLGTTGVITNFVGSNYTLHNITNARLPYTASATITGLAPGTYTIGLGILNGGALPITGDYVNGWVMVTN